MSSDEYTDRPDPRARGREFRPSTPPRRLPPPTAGWESVGRPAAPRPTMPPPPDSFAAPSYRPGPDSASGRGGSPGRARPTGRAEKPGRAVPPGRPGAPYPPAPAAPAYPAAPRRPSRLTGPDQPQPPAASPGTRPGRPLGEPAPAASTYRPRTTPARPSTPPRTQLMSAAPTGRESRAWAELDAEPRPSLPPHSPPPGPPRRTGGPGGPGRPPRRKRTAPPLIFARMVASALSIALLAIAGFVSANNFGGENKAISDALADKGIASLPTMSGKTILLVGADSRTNTDGTPLTEEELGHLNSEVTGGVQTDTIMVMTISESGDKATVVSIPRDSWITDEVVGDITGPYSDGSEGKYRANKVNSYYSSAKAYRADYLATQGHSGPPLNVETDIAGRTMLIKVVSKLIGRKIDAYAQVNLMAFYKLSKAIGGVEVCLNAPVDDKFSGANFPAGVQSVEGEKALAFVRQRKGLPGGDLDRIRRQQAFLGSAIKKVLSAGTLTSPGKLNALADAAKQTMVLDNIDLLSFGQEMQKLSGDRVTFTTIPTHGGAGNGGLAINVSEVRNIFTALHEGQAVAANSGSTEVDRSTVTVDVHNGTMRPGMAKKVGDQIVADGLRLGKVGDMPGKSHDNQLATTEIRYSEGAEQAAGQVQQILGFGTLTAAPELTRGRVLVVLGQDMPETDRLRQLAPLAIAPANLANPANPANPANLANLTNLANFPASTTITANTVPCVN